MTTVYLDACCLNRPFDDQTQARIRIEAEAVLAVLRRVETGELEWVTSRVVVYELRRSPDRERRRRVLLLVRLAGRVQRLVPLHAERARELVTLGFRPYDALHIACAEESGADVLLTTDDRMLRRAARVREELRVRVANPLTWVTEESTE